MLAMDVIPASCAGISNSRRTMRTIGMPSRFPSSSMPMSNGVKRKLLAQANRNGFYYVLDRASGKFLAGAPS